MNVLPVPAITLRPERTLWTCLTVRVVDAFLMGTTKVEVGLQILPEIPIKERAAIWDKEKGVCARLYTKHGGLRMKQSERYKRFLSG